MSLSVPVYVQIIQKFSKWICVCAIDFADAESKIARMPGTLHILNVQWEKPELKEGEEIENIPQNNR